VRRGQALPAAGGHGCAATPDISPTNNYAVMPAPTAGAPRHDTTRHDTSEIHTYHRPAPAASRKSNVCQTVVSTCHRASFAFFTNHHAARDSLQRSMEHALARPFRTAPGQFRRSFSLQARFVSCFIERRRLASFAVTGNVSGVCLPASASDPLHCTTSSQAFDA
jgi:hypothetical protein